jgi:hypothetical protein
MEIEGAGWSFYHLVGQRRQRRWNGQLQKSGGVHIDQERQIDPVSEWEIPTVLRREGSWRRYCVGTVWLSDYFACANTSLSVEFVMFMRRCRKA